MLIFDRLSGLKLFFKCENLQKTGAFKARGACNAVLKAKEELGDRLKGAFIVTRTESRTMGLISGSCGNFEMKSNSLVDFYAALFEPSLCVTQGKKFRPQF